MTTSLTIEREIHFERRGRGFHKELRPGPEPPRPAVLGRVPRIARLMALAIRFDGLIRRREIVRCTDLARLGHVTRARISQIMALLQLAPDIQELILFLPRTARGRDPIHLGHLLPITRVVDWKKQRRLWNDLIQARCESADASDITQPVVGSMADA
jgi:hypothetical protein